jgi:hypothetical protein
VVTQAPSKSEFGRLVAATRQGFAKYRTACSQHEQICRGISKMAGIEVDSQYLIDLRTKILEAGADYKSLNNFFVIGAGRLGRQEDVKQLQNLISKLKQQLDNVLLSEDGAKAAWSKADAIKDIGGLLGTVIGSITGKHDWEEKFEKNLSASQESKKQFFGTIMICLGKGGLPGDAQVVSISGLARAQNREESEIIREFQQQGKWLFSPGVFFEMLETLIEQLYEGKLHLPISLKQMPAKLAIPIYIRVDS